MHDPLSLRNPPWLQSLSGKLAESFTLKSLPAHAHEVIASALLYHFTLSYISPLVTNLFFAEAYAKLNKRTKFNWHVHVVALFQSVLVCAMAIWVVVNDQERPHMNTWQERVFGYTGSLGLVQAFAAGYFLWDLYICVRYFNLYGVGMLAHAVAALTVYGLGFRPFVNYYATSFILYELSSPFLNLHWFCDKMELTGSTFQMINGIILLISFAGARLIYGSYLSYNLISDILSAVSFYKQHPLTPPLASSLFTMNATALFNDPVQALQVVKYAPLTAYIPTWIWVANIASSGVMAVLNFYWYAQMISAIRKRFDPPFGTRRAQKGPKVGVTVNEDGSRTLEVESEEVKRRPQPQRLASELPPPT